MHHEAAKTLIESTLGNTFVESRYANFIGNLVNNYDRSKTFTHNTTYIKDAFKPYVKQLKRLGTYTDPNGRKVDILIVSLVRDGSLDRARTMQRNFVADYLKDRDQKDAALVAYVTESQEDWRFSFVKVDYETVIAKDGRVKVKEDLTPARRFSFLVGKNEPNHTAQAQLIPLLKEDGRLPTLEEIERAFNIETVTDQFFNEYKELFMRLKEGLDTILAKEKTASSSLQAAGVTTTTFAKKLLGQIVFLYFLQKKGWLGVKPGAEWGSGPKNFLTELFEKKWVTYNNFFTDVLEPLFYEALAIERPNNFFAKLNCQVPFLNGGLFEPLSGYDWQKMRLPLPNSLFEDIFTTFNLYNFTVREDEPLEKEVAVDPEMLGKVFENLLEISDRRSKGAFYTPREIVHFMCQESLINYLDTTINKPSEKLIQESPDQGSLFSQAKPIQKSLVLETDKPLVPWKDIEYLIYHGELSLGYDEAKLKGTESYEFKLPESIRKYAKEIDQALAEIKICDPAIGSGAFPVGLMTEIVKARNVLSAHLPADLKQTTYQLKREAIENSIYGVDIDPSAVDIARLRLWLSLVVDEDNFHHIQPLPNLDYKIVCGNSLQSIKQGFLKGDIEQLKKEYFNETNREKKILVKSRIDQIIKSLTNNRPIFDFQIYFSEIFSSQKGFDVVIGNPPYLESRSPDFSDVLKDYLQDQLKQRYGKESEKIPRGSDLLIYFYELSLRLINNSGYVVLITQNSWLDTDYGFKFQNFLLKRTNVLGIIDSDYKYFDGKNGPNINTVITVFRGKNPTDQPMVFARYHTNFDMTPISLKSISNEIDNSIVSYKFFNSGNSIIRDFKWGFLFNSDDFLIEILNILSSKAKQIDQIKGYSLSMGQGLNLTKDCIVDSDDLERFPFIKKGLIPFITNSDMNQFVVQKTSRYLVDQQIIFPKERKELKSVGIKLFDPQSTRKTRPILVMPRGIGNKHFCILNLAKAYSSSCVDIYDDGENVIDEIKLNLWIFFNSSLFWLFREVSGRKNLGGGMLKAEATDIRNLPVYIDFRKNNEIRRLFKSLAKRNVLSVEDEINSNEHKEIDRIVFEHLGLDENQRNCVIEALLAKVRERHEKSRT